VLDVTRGTTLLCAETPTQPLTLPYTDSYSPACSLTSMLTLLYWRTDLGGRAEQPELPRLPCQLLTAHGEALRGGLPQ
jgi:hypothetical protein